jgi:membrane-associated protease RseP (regulator of RpoE activity)
MLTTTAKLKNREGNTKILSKDDIENEKFRSLGVEFENLTDSEKKKLQLNNGVKIAEIKNNSKLAQSDVPEGFIVTKVNKKPVNNIDDIKQVINDSKGNILMEGVMPGYSGKYYFSFSL